LKQLSSAGENVHMSLPSTHDIITRAENLWAEKKLGDYVPIDGTRMCISAQDISKLVEQFREELTGCKEKTPYQRNVDSAFGNNGVYREYVSIYQGGNSIPAGQKKRTEDLMLLGIVLPEMVQQVRQRGLEYMCLDATFRTSKEKVLFFVLLAVESPPHQRGYLKEGNQGYPIGFLLVEPTTSADRHSSSIASETLVGSMLASTQNILLKIVDLITPQST